MLTNRQHLMQKACATINKMMHYEMHELELSRKADNCSTVHQH